MTVKEYKAEFIRLCLQMNEEHGNVSRVVLNNVTGTVMRDFESQRRDDQIFSCDIIF